MSLGVCCFTNFLLVLIILASSSLKGSSRRNPGGSGDRSKGSYEGSSRLNGLKKIYGFNKNSILQPRGIECHGVRWDRFPDPTTLQPTVLCHNLFQHLNSWIPGRRSFGWCGTHAHVYACTRIYEKKQNPCLDGPVGEVHQMSGQLKEFASLEIGPILQINVPKLMLSAGVQVSKSISIDLTWNVDFFWLLYTISPSLPFSHPSSHTTSRGRGCRSLQVGQKLPRMRKNIFP